MYILLYYNISIYILDIYTYVAKCHVNSNASSYKKMDDYPSRFALVFLFFNPLPLLDLKRGDRG